MREYVIHPMVVGINETDQGVMTYLKGYGKRIYLPSTSSTWKAARRRSWWTPASSSSWCRPGSRNSAASRSRSLRTPWTVSASSPKTSTYHPHSSAQRPLRKRLQVHQRQSLRAAAKIRVFQDPTPLTTVTTRTYWMRWKSSRWTATSRSSRGSVLLTPGHTVGGQCVVVNTPRGKAVITGFC